MEGYGGNGGSQRKSQGEWSQNSEQMQKMTTPIFKPHYSISEMIQRPSLFPSSFSAFLPPAPRFSSSFPTIEVENVEGKEE